MFVYSKFVVYARIVCAHVFVHSRARIARVHINTWPCNVLRISLSKARIIHILHTYVIGNRHYFGRKAFARYLVMRNASILISNS